MNLLKESKIKEGTYKLMKLATYKKTNNSDQIFGFKKNDTLIDIYELSKHINENNNDNRFLLIPRTLKETL